MRKFLIISTTVLVIAFIVIQFFQPIKNISGSDLNLITTDDNIPENVKEILRNGCIDCHSDNTRYHWYHKIAPVSWMVNKHVTEGKKELNLSKWKSTDDFGKITTLEDIRQEIERGTMPLKAYVMMHPESKMSEEKKKVLLEWINKKSDELMNQPEK